GGALTALCCGAGSPWCGARPPRAGRCRGGGGGGPRRAGVVVTVASFDVADGRVSRVWAVRNPEKLRPWVRGD
ncbi:hypothetical protein ACH5A8_12285, partial [Streptomyces sp. NPDC018610]